MVNTKSLPTPLNDAWFTQQILETSPYGTVLVDVQQPDMPIVYVNPAFEQATGYTSDEILGRNARFLQGNDTNQDEISRMREAIHNEETCSVILRNYRKDGSLFWNELNLNPLRDPQGQVTHYVAMHRDSSETQQTQQALRFLNRTAAELIKLPDEVSIYQYVGQELAALLDNAIVVINRVVDADHTVNQGIFGIDNPLLEPIRRLVGYHPTGNTYPMHSEAKRYFGSGKLELYPGDLAEWASGVVPRAITRSLQQLTQLNRLYFIGLQKDGVLYADVQIYTRSQTLVRNPDLIEAFINQAAAALYRTQAEESLRDAERLYRALFEQSNDAVFIMDTEGKHRQVNHRAAHMLGYERDELIGLSADVIVAPDNYHKSRKRLEQLLAGEQFPPYERQFRCKDGSTLPVEINANVVEDERGQRHIISIVRDITFRKQMEAELREQHDVFEAFLNQSNDGIVLVDSEIRITEWNPAQEEITGISREQALGQPLLNIQALNNPAYVYPEQIAKLEQMMKLVVAGEAMPWLGLPVETEIKRYNDGALRIVQSVVFPIDTTQGRMLGSIIRDITERKQAEQRDFDIALEKERVGLLTRFIQIVAHEFRTPLSIISSSSHLLTRIDDPERRTQKAQGIQAQVEQTSHLIDMMLKMARLEGSTHPLTPIDASRVLQQCCHELNSRPGTPPLELTTCEKPIIIQGNEALFWDALEALVDNAQRFGPDEGPITVTCRQQDDDLLITVADHGPGITPADQAYIFDTFWRQDSAHTTPGLGLGLSIAKKIVDLHHGKIWVESVVGEGSRFHIRIPIDTVKPSLENAH